ncbi:S-layer homology domain-containing protein [Oscillospiraceae bacterium MB08-C2-2]|nr:S-layer homology domain-containing protein [Oscillospiraceae bacterium MB08-C2-2]
MKKRLLSFALALCMMLTQLPISAMAKEADISIGASGEIIAFAPLDKTELSVSAGTAIENLGLPESLTATVRTTAIADSGTAEESEQDSGNPDNLTEAIPGSATPTDSGQQAKADETTPPEWNITTPNIPVTWEATPEYQGNENGVYIFTPVIEGYTVSADLPKVAVTVGAAKRQMIRTAPNDPAVFSVAINIPLEINVLPIYGNPQVNEMLLPSHGFTQPTDGSKAAELYWDSTQTNPITYGDTNCSISSILQNKIYFYATEQGTYTFTATFIDDDTHHDYPITVTVTDGSTAEARWGVAGSGGSAPAVLAYGTLDDAMTYANSLESGTAYIQLREDVAITETLVFASGKATILDLNGKDIDRGLTAATANGNVITVSGSLTLKDSSTTEASNQGHITGGYSSNDTGGGVCVSGNFTLQGGDITGNKTTVWGGGVRVKSGALFMMQGGSITGNEATGDGGAVSVPDATFSMTGGSITGNESPNVGGISIYASGTYKIGGTAVIKDNIETSGGTKRNVFVYSYNSLSIDTPFTTGASIWVTSIDAPTSGSPRNITGTSSADYSGYFHSDNSSYIIQNGANNVVQLAVTVPTIGELTISNSFMAGKRLYLDDVAAYVPTVTPNGYTITAQGWQASVNSSEWIPWSGATSYVPLDTNAFRKLRYFITYTDRGSEKTITSNEITFNVMGYTTELALAAAPANQQILGSAITLTATLMGFYSGSNINGQTITFKNGETTLGTATLNADGVAAYTWSPSVADAYTLTAEYAANAYNKAATSSTVNYAVIVDPNIAAVDAAGTALVNGTVNVAFNASQADKTAAVQAYVNSLLTGDAAGVTATVTYNNSTGKYDAAISKGSVNDTKSLSMTVKVAPDPDIATVANAKTVAQGASYADMTQAAATDENAIKTALKNAAAVEVNNSGVTITINKLSYIAPIAGTSANPSGTDGSYTFTATVSKGSYSETTGQKIITITATPYTGVTDAQAVAAAGTALVNGIVNVAFDASQADKTAAVQAYVNSLLTGDAAGVTATVIYNIVTKKYEVLFSKGSVNDTKSLSMTVKVAPDPDIATVANAKTVAQEAIYGNMTQTATANESAVETALKSTAETEISNSGVTITINKVSYTAPIAGTSANPSGTNGSYTFTVRVSKGSQSETTEQKTMTITATPYAGGSGGNDNGGRDSDSGSDRPTLSTKPTEPVTGSTENKATVDNTGNASVSLTDKNITDAIANAQAEAAKKGVSPGDITAVIHVTTAGKDADTVTVNLPKTTQEKVIGNKIFSVQLVIDRPDLTIGIDLAAVTEINRQAKADVQLSATRMDNTKLPGDAKAAIGSRPAYDLKALYGNGKSVTDFGKGSVSVEIPYTLQKNEAAGYVYAVYVDAKGKVTYLTDSSYDAKRGTVVFSTSHFSTYGVAYKAGFNFTDIGGHWAKDDILFAANRGLITGTSTTTFSPGGSMTRGMFVTALGRLANADIRAYKQSSFTDVKADAYYMGYIEWASKNNILVGTEGGKFDPDGLVTREQMAVIMRNYAKAMGYTVPKVHVENIFSDNAKISTHAKEAVKQMQMAGVISGKNSNLFDPQGTATRAEVSAVLRRFVELMIFSDTMQGWTMNHSGQWMFYQNGRPATGKKDIESSTYTFDQYGVVADVPKNLRYTTYTVQKGDSFWLIAHKLGCSMSELEELNNTSRFSTILPGDVLSVPEK